MIASVARDQALDLAGGAIAAGLHDRDPLLPEPSDLARDLLRPRPSFVTLIVGEELNGCIGSIAAEEPLGREVSQHAWSAAFTDPRLPRLRWADVDELTIEISVLSSFRPVSGADVAALASVVTRDVHGLLIRSGTKRALFLPSVWAQFRSSARFVHQLFTKAGLDPAREHPDLEAFVFTSTKFGGRVSGDVLRAG